MARPKGVKNNTTAPAPTEFNYEDSDAIYQSVMSKGAVAPVRDEIDLALQTSEEVVYAQAITTVNPALVQSPSLIYLVEGKVRLDQDGSPPIVSDQRRIVNATNVDEALKKFVNYFSGMSNPVQRYSVVQAAASETIL